ncbi:MAG: response regulator [Candidatus Omnitrophica bacterium]|nr:response regulator [Candidatus Omnitrophota bacterium]
MPKKVLVVEDEIDAAKVLVKRLQTQGFEVILAVDAYQGTAFINREKPDVVILDLMLPAGGGASVLKNVRSNVTVAYTPIIILTGIRDEKIKEEMLNQGVDAYIEKPYDADNLIAKINEVLNKKG